MPGYLLISVLEPGATAYRRCLNADRFVRMSAMIISYVSGHGKNTPKSGNKIYLRFIGT